VLTGLAGVEVPVASAIVTVVDPERFTIIDFRALWSLCIDGEVTTRWAFISNTSPPAAGSLPPRGTDLLRTLDKALRQYFSEHQPRGA
jgi:hypothetical protein